MPRTAKAIQLLPKEQELLAQLCRSREINHSLVLRSKIILKASEGLDNKTISQNLRLSPETIAKWRQRWLENYSQLQRFITEPHKWKEIVKKILADRPRSGSPGKFEAEQICQIIPLACQTPAEYLSHWTRKELVRETIKRGIAENISATTIGRFLKSGRIKASSK